MTSSVSTLVAHLAFSSPDTTRKVLSHIAQIRPSVLLVVADGPRPDYPTDAERCASVFDIVSQIDWPADVITNNYSPEDMECGRRTSTEVTWDSQLLFASLLIDWHNVMPSRIQVTTLGFGTDGTHTVGSSSDLAEIPARGPDIQSIHPDCVIRRVAADWWTEDHVFGLARRGNAKPRKRNRSLDRLHRRIRRER